jgi:hypothetical protein
MIHYVSMSGPKKPEFDGFISQMREKHTCQAAWLAVALFTNTTSSGGKKFPDRMYKLDRVTALVEHA